MDLFSSCNILQALPMRISFTKSEKVLLVLLLKYLQNAASVMLERLATVDKLMFCLEKQFS